MKIHILGVCGTFMGGLAIIAKQLGHDVAGTDANVYPPMSDALREAGITLYEGYDPTHLKLKPDLVIVGNAMSRGNPMLEAVLNQHLPYTSGPQWLSENVLQRRHVVAVAGTHGKTTVTSLLTWILSHAEKNPGYLVGGMPKNFTRTAELGEDPFFVIEADEYDTAFFDKRSKFIHYRPQTLIINNLEFDHADIFPDLAAIQSQFQILLRTVPSSGLIIHPHDNKAIDDVIKKGCWSRMDTIGFKEGVWRAQNIKNDGSAFEVWHRDQRLGHVEWSQFGMHSVHNALVSIAAAHDLNIDINVILSALEKFEGVKRRLEIRGVVNGVTVYDDFAHHPTAIASTLAGLRARVGQQRIVTVLEFGSNTMKQGMHAQELIESLTHADVVAMLQPEGRQWDPRELLGHLNARANVYDSVKDIVDDLTPQLRTDDHVLIMSNKGFDGIHQKLLNRLDNAFLKNFGQKNGVDLSIPNQHKTHDPMDFEE